MRRETTGEVRLRGRSEGETRGLGARRVFTETCGTGTDEDTETGTIRESTVKERPTRVARLRISMVFWVEIMRDEFPEEPGSLRLKY